MAGRKNEHSSISVERFVEEANREFTVEVESGESGLQRVIKEQSLNRPGLALSGFFQYFAHRRIQVLGLAEITYLKSLHSEERAERIRMLFERQIPCVAIARNRHPLDEMMELSNELEVPIIRSPLITMHFINKATLILEKLTAPRERLQGTMVEVNGVGILLEGKPGIGKSETALALIERGHSLVSDDVTLMHQNSSGQIVGSAETLTRYHMEIRGVGIIHVPSLFGVAAMRPEMRLDLVMHLKDQDEKGGELPDRSGLSHQSREILEGSVPMQVIPVAPGRDLAHLVEVAALNQKLKLLGHDAAKELDEKLINNFTGV